jgi:D-hexose-6-phosphate mutarotase
MDIKQLNEKYAIAGHIQFEEGKGGLSVAKISNKYADSVVSLYGAHVQSFQPKGQKNVLWLSPQSDFEVGKPIRGGIPVCFPWFGPHPSDGQKPAHGFARLLIWDVVKTSILASGGTELILGLKNSANTQTLWPYSFSAQMRILVDNKLDVTLSYTNTGNETFTCSDALHTYFQVSDSGKIDIAGLAGHNYYAGFAKEADKKQSEIVLTVKQEENRRYINHIADSVIVDDAWGRKIRVAKRGSKITVVWNPWEANTKTIGDIPDDGYKSFVCVESVNAYDDAAVLKPGESHSVSTIVTIE